ncbi:MAG TPA: sulfate ABC transporter substrate-binding protein [Planctomycetota bacterium]
MTMRTLTAILMWAALTGCGKAGDAVTITNVSYDPTRELYRDLGVKFSAYYQAKAGRSVTLQNSHAGSGAQARAVIGGLKADVVTLALAPDIDAIAERGLLKPDWQKAFPNNSSPYTSTIVFVVRAGNPKGIKDWDDLVKPGVSVITPNPKTSGGARWNFLAAWGFITQNGGTEAQAQDFVKKLFANVPVLDTGARGSTTTFVQKKIGDVFISWENEAHLSLKEAAGQVQIVYPPASILAEPPVAVVDKNVDQAGTRAVAEEFIRFLYTDEAQEVIGAWHYRPSNPAILAKFGATLPPFKKLFTIADVAGTWKDAQKKYFGDGGVFDKIYEPQ